ncbi:MAG: substrate-binding domain-containing protein [Deltaproteobacteria bacterium]|nr:substrate-binding domain-containing protein [Deltaproteobacteria bacterium]
MQRHNLIFLSAFFLLISCHEKKELILFVAPSLASVIAEMEPSFNQVEPDIHIRSDISGSQVAARKLTELNMRADILALADIEVIEKMLIPNHAKWSIRFATNSVVLAHFSHSRYTEEITPENWPDILSRPDVKIGLANPDTAPIGYRSIMVWLLAAKYYQRLELAQTLRKKVAPEHLVSDEAELWALLPSKAIDYAFLYRSTAEKHRLKITRLPDQINLSKPELAKTYAKANVPVLMKTDNNKVVMQGMPLYFGMTIPIDAPHPEIAVLLAKQILSKSGQAALVRAGFTPLVPATAAHRELLPSALIPLTVMAQ